MLSLMILLAAAGPEFVPARPSCPPARLVLKNGQMPGPEDEKAMEHARKRCPQIYNQSPCLIYLVKTAPRTYQVTCGAPEDAR